MDNEQTKQGEETASSASSKPSRMNWRIALIALAIIALAASAFFLKGFAVAASVNGSFISRISVVNELEKRGGMQALDSLITRKLVDAEAKKKNIIIDPSEIAGEIQTIESQMTSMGATLQDQLQQQGMTEEDLRNQLSMHLKLEKLLADKIQASDADVDAYIASQKVRIEGGGEAEAREKIKEQIREDKLNEFADSYITELRNSANIKYYVTY